MSSSVQPPADYGTPLGIVEIDPAVRVGPCLAGRSIFQGEQPCPDTPSQMLAIGQLDEDGESTGDQMYLPLCGRHNARMAEILAGETGEPS